MLVHARKSLKSDLFLGISNLSKPSTCTLTWRVQGSNSEVISAPAHVRASCFWSIIGLHVYSSIQSHLPQRGLALTSLCHFIPCFADFHTGYQWMPVLEWVHSDGRWHPGHRLLLRGCQTLSDISQLLHSLDLGHFWTPPINPYNQLFNEYFLRFFYVLVTHRYEEYSSESNCWKFL